MEKSKFQGKYTFPDKYSHIDFTSLGFRKTTDLEIARGKPPFIFDIYKHDNAACSSAKSLYNSSSELLFTANQDYFSALEPFVQTMALTHTINSSTKTIATNCVPKGYKL
jgi:hypothetical protein